MPALLRIAVEVDAGIREPQTALEAYGQAMQSLDPGAEDGTYHVLSHRMMKFYSFRSRQFFYEPIASFEELRHIDWCNSRLAAGSAPEWAGSQVMIGFRMLRSMYTAPQGVLPLAIEGDREVGDHSVSMVGWDHEIDCLAFLNSWGREWGDDGFGYMSGEYFQTYGLDAWAARKFEFGPHPLKAARFRRSTRHEDFAYTWLIPVRPWRRRARHRRMRLEWVIYETLSASELPVEIIDIRTAYGLRIAWAHVHHLLDDDRSASVVKELFVWPAFRGMGLGRLLEAACVDVAWKFGARRIRVWLHEADDIGSTQSAGREFLRRCGYQFVEAKQVRPCLTGVGEKTIPNPRVWA